MAGGWLKNKKMVSWLFDNVADKEGSQIYADQWADRVGESLQDTLGISNKRDGAAKDLTPLRPKLNLYTKTPSVTVTKAEKGQGHWNS